MFILKIPIASADKLFNGISFSEDALKDMVAKFKVNSSLLGVSYVVPNTQVSLPLGVIHDLEYNESNKTVEATLHISLSFSLGGQAVTKLSTPNGTRITEFSLKGLGAFFTIPQQPQSKIIK